mgnify:CR=1 FL=1
MSEELLVRHCSPTLAGMKTGNLFGCPFATAREMTQDVRRLNSVLVKKGLRVLPLQYQNGRALLYVYRPAQLSRDLQQATACRLLRERGYDAAAPEHCITRLMQRLRTSEEFPHEIGLFLGYPIEDVVGFIRYAGKGCKLSGLWKVYGDAEAASRLFDRLSRVCHAVTRRVDKGETLLEVFAA